MDQDTQLEQIKDMLYDLDRDALRRLAWECLLISDGPDKIDGDVKGPVHVGFVERSTDNCKSNALFTHFRVWNLKELP